MKKETLIGAIVLAVILGGIVFSTATKPLPTKPGTGVALSGGSYVEHAAYYDIAANYASSTPLFTKVSAAADATAVSLMKKFVSDTITQFKTDGNFANLTPKDVATMGLGQDRKETLQIGYLIASSPRTVTYIFTVYEDTLGAHGNTFFTTFAFDTKTGSPLALADIFAPGTDYLGTLSTIARKELPGVIGDGADAAMIKDGTAPEEKNFATFFFDNDYFVVLFAPYQVAPYTAGPQTLRIPLVELADILKPEYR